MPAIRAISVVVLAVAGTLWLRDTLELLRFMVALLGRMPFVTPVWVYSALMLACGAMVVPPFIAAVAATKPLVRPSLVTTALLVAVVVTAGFAYAAPAYTFNQPQRRYMRVLTEPGAATSTFEVGSQEPGLDLDAAAPGGWYRATDAPTDDGAVRRCSDRRMCSARPRRRPARRRRRSAVSRSNRSPRAPK